MPEPVPFLHCDCGSTTFRVPMEHKKREFTIECARCQKQIEAPQQSWPKGYHFPCPLRELV